MALPVTLEEHHGGSYCAESARERAERSGSYHFVFMDPPQVHSSCASSWRFNEHRAKTGIPDNLVCSVRCARMNCLGERLVIARQENKELSLVGDKHFARAVDERARFIDRMHDSPAECEERDFVEFQRY